MKINDIVNEEKQKIHDSLLLENTTGVSTADLVKVVQAQKENKWSSPMDVDYVIEQLKRGAPLWKI